MQRSKRQFRSTYSTGAGFGQSAREAAARARSEKKTQELENLFLTAIREGWGEEFRVAGLAVIGLRWSIVSVDTDAKTVCVETTDRSAPFRSYPSLPYRAVTHSPLEWVEGTDAGQNFSSDLIALLNSDRETDASNVRVNGLNKRGLRFSVVSLDTEEGTVTLKGPDGTERVESLGNVTHAPLTSSPKVKGQDKGKDNLHLNRHAAGVPWGEKDA